MFHHKINNQFRATRPRHLLSNDPRKLVTEYQVRQEFKTHIITMIGIALLAAFCALIIFGG